MKAPEYSSSVSALHASAFVDGEPLSAHVLRELARQTNRQASRSSPIFRFVGYGARIGVQYAPARWRYASPSCAIPVRKRLGVQRLRTCVRAYVESGRRVAFALLSDASPRADEVAAYIDGSGAIVSVAWETECPSSSEILLSPMWRAVVDPSSDPLVTSAQWIGLSASTFGDATWGTPTIATNTGTGQFATHGPHHFRDQYVTSQFVTYLGARGWRVAPNDTAAIQRAGMYAFVFDSGFSGAGTAYECGPYGATIVSPGIGDAIYTIDTVPRSVLGKIYSMNRLPEAQILSWAVYEA